MMEAVKRYNWKYIISWCFTLGLPLCILLLPSGAVLTTQIKLFLAITLLAILVFAFENMNQTTMAILLPVLYIVFQIAPPNIALSSWTANVLWMYVGGLILAAVLERVGLLKRIAYKCIILMGASYNGILYGLAIAGTLLNIIIPAQAVIPMAALSYGICAALGIGKGKEAAGIMLTAALGAILPTLFLFSGNYVMIMTTGTEITGPLSMGWIEFFMKNGVSILFMFLTVFAYTKMFKPTVPISGKAYFQEAYDQLGPMSRDEKKSLGVCLVLFLLLLTIKYHGIQPGWIFVFVPILLFVPGINVGHADDIKNLNFGFIIFVASCMGIGAVAGSLGIGQIVSAMAMPILVGKSVNFVLMFVWLLCVLLNFLLTPLAIIATFTVPLAQISLDLGINPHAMYLVMLHALDQLVMPYEIALYLIYFSFGLVYLKDFAKAMFVKLLINGVFIFVILIPFWRIIGFLNL